MAKKPTWSELKQALIESYNLNASIMETNQVLLDANRQLIFTNQSLIAHNDKQVIRVKELEGELRDKGLSIPWTKFNQWMT